MATEYWLRGPLPGIPALLQPVAHALLQARDEVTTIMTGFPNEKLWEQPFGLASPGFHLQHLRGVLDRLFTYANNAALDPAQLEALAAEGRPYEGNDSVTALLQAFHQQVDSALQQLQDTGTQQLTDTRSVGRARIPSTLLGLLFHAAEHTMRHTGQLLVTVKALHS